MILFSLKHCESKFKIVSNFVSDKFVVIANISVFITDIFHDSHEFITEILYRDNHGKYCDKFVTVAENFCDKFVTVPENSLIKTEIFAMATNLLLTKFETISQNLYSQCLTRIGSLFDEIVFLKYNLNVEFVDGEKILKGPKL